jgi:hypothetical protein
VQPVSPQTFEYVRQARRIRARRGATAAQRQQAIANLNRGVSAPWTPAVRAAPAKKVVRTPSASAVSPFEAEVQKSLVGGLLTYGERQRLISGAMALGLNRFEANLAIAQVLHRLPKSARSGLECPGQLGTGKWVVMALLCQAIIVAAVFFKLGLA